MVNITFAEVSKKIYEYAWPAFDVVVGIGRGGIVPASLIAHQHQVELHITQVNYRDDANNPRFHSPVLLSDTNPWDSIALDKKILLVDDVSVTGTTMNYVLEYFNNHKVITFALKGKADHVLFSDIKSCVHWPWKVNET
jgi:uncharacterized protein